MGMPPSSRTTVAPCAEHVPYFSTLASFANCNIAEPTPPEAPWINILCPGRAGPGLRRSMQHLIRGDVVQHHGDRLRRVQSRRHGDELALGHAHVLRIAPMDGH